MIGEQVKVFPLFIAACLTFSVAVAQETTEQMASYYYQSGEYDKAIELYEPLYSRTLNDFYYQMLYHCYVETADLKSAENLVEKRIKKYPKELKLLVDLGHIYQIRDNRKKAEKTYLSAIDKIGYDSKQISDLAMAFEKNDLPQYAIQVYLRARQNMNNPVVYVMELATLYEKGGDYEKMMQEYFNLLDSSPGSIGSIQISLQRALSETSTDQLAEGLRKTLTSRIRQQPNNNSYLEMMIWFSLQQKDFDFALTQAKAIDARFSEQGAQQVMRVAQIAENNEAYEVAEEGYRYIVDKGEDHALYFDSRVALLNVKFKKINLDHAIGQRELTSLLREYETTLNELGKNLATVPLIRNYSHLLAYNGVTSDFSNLQKASDLLYDVVEMARLPKNTLNEVKLELGDLLLFAGEVWDASLLYSQVEKANKNDIIGSMAKFRNAKLSYYNGDFQWAKSQLDVLRASTSKTIANDAMQLSLLISDNMEEDSTYDMLQLYASADLMLYRNQLDSAWSLLDEIAIRNLSHPLFDEVLMQKAKIRMKQARYEEADSLLQFVVDHYASDILADDALFMLAELNSLQLNNKEKTRQCYERLVLDYPESLYIDQARRRLAAMKQ